jgi:hypothetical protein
MGEPHVAKRYGMKVWACRWPFSRGVLPECYKGPLRRPDKRYYLDSRLEFGVSSISIYTDSAKERRPDG